MSEKRATHGATTACRDGSGWWLRTTGDGWLQKCAVLLALLCAGLAAAPALAQIESATLRGNVAGQDAAPSAGVAVVARDVDRGYTSTTTTRADGSYIFVGLKPGTYEISVGGRTEEVTLRVGQIASLDFGGGAGTEAVEEIVVTGTKVASFTGGEVGTNITPEMMERLPQTDRNFLAFADLAPGVQVDRGTGGQVHIRGGAQNINKINVFLDGVSQKALWAQRLKNR